MVEVRFAAFAVVTPVPATTLIMVGELLVQVPPGVGSVRVRVLCRQISPGPEMGESGLTVIE
jgi:hypothetical protein